MARRLLRNEILGKTVMTANGSVLGVLEEMVLDTETGEIKYILVRSDNNRATGQKIESKGRCVYTFSKMIVGEKNVTVS